MTDPNDDLLFRWAVAEDFDALGEVMFDAVRSGDSLYSEKQRQAWVPAPRKDKIWRDRLASQQIIIALRGEKIVGFMSLAKRGYIDFAYIRPALQQSGLFRKLYARIEQKATSEQQKRLWVHASLKAQPAFAAMGFQTIKPEEVSLGGQTFKRFEMEKLLG